MSLPRPWKLSVLHELHLALQDRRAGREGRARVRCRIAAGYILREYFRRRGIPDPWGQNALYRMEYALRLPDLPPAAQQALKHLTMRVDDNFSLPPHIDLVEDVLTLAHVLLGETLRLPENGADENR